MDAFNRGSRDSMGNGVFKIELNKDGEIFICSIFWGGLVRISFKQSDSVDNCGNGIISHCNFYSLRRTSS